MHIYIYMYYLDAIHMYNSMYIYIYICIHVYIYIWPVAGLLRNSFKTSFRIPSPGMKLPGKERWK